ncbi:uncharacterized protein BX663DRAFT_32693 [Cokeromyces recurvatus]|uniref:uncharacterized protein n=1 Tax=Cokeromyces recurvatus TaxID=90255 RepID=UPI002220CA04|nr:uncharacterized protein BX663DRAFT_32693 [Cokeromyces recurvatus]KAI7903520.1 hypothetical protein BX663DRAFT_32693 [Cokeromyces recurvatus]
MSITSFHYYSTMVEVRHLFTPISLSFHLTLSSLILLNSNDSFLRLKSRGYQHLKGRALFSSSNMIFICHLSKVLIFFFKPLFSYPSHLLSGRTCRSSLLLLLLLFSFLCKQDDCTGSFNGVHHGRPRTY